MKDTRVSLCTRLLSYNKCLIENLNQSFSQSKYCTDKWSQVQTGMPDEIKPKLHFYCLSTKLLVPAQNFHSMINTMTAIFLSKPPKIDIGIALKNPSPRVLTADQKKIMVKELSVVPGTDHQEHLERPSDQNKGSAVVSSYLESSVI